MDEHNRKMSKSLKNIISPDDIIKHKGVSVIFVHARDVCVCVACVRILYCKNVRKLRYPSTFACKMVRSVIFRNFEFEKFGYANPTHPTHTSHLEKFQIGK